jgi:ribosome-binding protein aMBF1 (putative translation factor)
VDEDSVGLARALTGEDRVICDFCGQPVQASAVVRIEGAPAVSEPVEVLHVCDDCRLRIEQEEIPFEEEIAAGLQTAEE